MTAKTIKKAEGKSLISNVYCMPKDEVPNPETSEPGTLYLFKKLEPSQNNEEIFCYGVVSPKGELIINRVQGIRELQIDILSFFTDAQLQRGALYRLDSMPHKQLREAIEALIKVNPELGYGSTRSKKPILIMVIIGHV